MVIYHNDHLGTPQKMTDSTGTIVWAADYDPFGKATVTISTIENNMRLPGQYYDSETGLHYNYFRYYDPETGRYLTPDPIGLEGGINPYVYVTNNPINWIDPWGLQRGRRGGSPRGYIRQQQRTRALEIRRLEKEIRDFDPSFRYTVIRRRHDPIEEEENEHLRDILRDYRSERQSEFCEQLKPRERTRDRIQSVEDAIAQLEGISRQQNLTPERIQSIQKSIDNLRYQLRMLQNLNPPNNDYVE